MFSNFMATEWIHWWRVITYQSVTIVTTALWLGFGLTFSCEVRLDVLDDVLPDATPDAAIIVDVSDEVCPVLFVIAPPDPPRLLDPAVPPTDKDEDVPRLAEEAPVE